LYLVSKDLDTIMHDLYYYILSLALMTIITLSIIIYAIVKSDFSKRTFRVIVGMFVIDTLVLILFVVKTWF